MFQAVATAFPEAAAVQTSVNMPDEETAGNPDSSPSSVTEAEIVEQKLPEVDQMSDESFEPTFKISTNKKNAGQLMFDFG